MRVPERETRPTGPAANTSAVTTAYAYDNVGNQTSIAAPLSRNTTNAYDPLNRLSQITDPNSGNTYFTYDAENDRYTCPAGEHLTKGKVRSDRRDNIDHYRNLTACPTCALKPRCTPDKVKRLKRWEHESVLDKMQARLDHMPEAMTIRRQTVEHPFGTLKAWMGSTHFLTKTLEKVKTEMSLQALAYNMKRMINLFGVNPLMQAIAA